ncbi:MAG: chemotaxis protein CheW [Bdellovibrionales bacterium]
MIDDHIETENTEKHLVYQLGSELFATPLIEVREVVEYRQAKPIPHTAPFFKGVINIRGEIIGVLDLRERMNVPNGAEPVAQLVFETDHGPLAATVDRVLSVSIIPDEAIDRRTSVQAETSERPYFIGVGKADGQIMTVVSLRKILTPEELVKAMPSGTRPR